MVKTKPANPYLGKQTEAIEWLEDHPEVAPRMKKTEGFSVKKGTTIRRQNGAESDLLETCLELDIRDGSVVDGYEVRHLEKSDQYEERLLFFAPKETLDAPF